MKLIKFECVSGKDGSVADMYINPNQIGFIGAGTVQGELSDPTGEKISKEATGIVVQGLPLTVNDTLENVLRKLEKYYPTIQKTV